ncbi:hypothetical protein QOT17_019725 [Balamuthia mandrillaris]
MEEEVPQQQMEQEEEREQEQLEGGGTSELASSQSRTKKRRVSSATAAGLPSRNWSSLPMPSSTEWQKQSLPQLLDVLFPGVLPLAKNTYGGKLQKELLARLIEAVRQEQAGPSEAPNTAGAEKQPEQQSSPGLKEEEFSGEPPLTLFAGRVFTFTYGVMVWFKQMKTYAVFGKREVPLSQLLCRLHCPHFVPGKTIVRPMTEEEKQAHHKIFSRLQTSQPSPRGRTAVASGGGGGAGEKKGKEKESEQGQGQGEEQGQSQKAHGCLGIDKSGTDMEAIDMAQAAYRLFNSQSHEFAEKVDVMTCDEALVTLNTTTKRIAFIMFHADKWGGPEDEPYKELPEVFYHKKLDAYMQKLRLSAMQSLSPRHRRLKWLATHGIMQRKNKFEAILPAVLEQDRARYVASWFQRNGMAELYGNQPIFMAVKQMLDSQKVICASDNDEAMLKNIWDWILSDTLIALCGCTFDYRYETEWAAHVWYRVFDWRHCAAFRFAADLPFHLDPSIYDGLPLHSDASSAKSNRDRRPDVLLSITLNQDSSHRYVLPSFLPPLTQGISGHTFPFLFVEISAEAIADEQTDHKDHKKLLVCMRLALEKQILKLLQSTHEEKQFIEALQELRVFGALTAASKLFLFAMRPLLDIDHRSVVYEWHERAGALDILHVKDVIAAFECFERMSRAANLMEKVWNNIGTRRVGPPVLQFYLPVLCDIPAARPNHAAVTPTKNPPKDRKRSHTSDSGSTGHEHRQKKQHSRKGTGNDKGDGQGGGAEKKGRGGEGEVHDACSFPSSDSAELQPEVLASLQTQSLLPADFLPEIRGWIPKGGNTWVSKGPEGKVVILKCRKRPNQELDLLRRVTPHPNLPTLHFSAERQLPDGRYASVMVQNRLMSMQEAATGPASGAVCALACAVDIMQAMLHLHSQGICHRDIKPRNIMWDPNTNHWVLLDLDLASVWLIPCKKEEREQMEGSRKRERALPPPRLLTSRYVGTHGFMAPEVHACDGLEEYDAFLADTWSFARSMQAVFMERTGVLPHRSMPALNKLLEEATHPQPHCRPSLHTALPNLQELLHKFQAS